MYSVSVIDIAAGHLFGGSSQKGLVLLNRFSKHYKWNFSLAHLSLLLFKTINVHCHYRILIIIRLFIRLRISFWAASPAADPMVFTGYYGFKYTCRVDSASGGRENSENSRDRDNFHRFPRSVGMYGRGGQVLLL